MILPQETRIDNFHGPLHIHPPRDRGAPIPIEDRPLEAVRGIIRRHAERQGTIVFDELLGELR